MGGPRDVPCRLNGHELAVWDEVDDLFHRPTGPDVIGAMDTEKRHPQLGDVSRQARAFDVLPPRLVGLAMDLHDDGEPRIGSLVPTSLAPGLIDCMPLAVVVDPRATRDADHS